MKFIISIDDTSADIEDQLCGALSSLNLQLEKHIIGNTLFVSALHYTAPVETPTVTDTISTDAECIPSSPEHAEEDPTVMTEPAIEPAIEPMAAATGISTYSDCLILNFSTIFPVKTCIDPTLQYSRLCVSKCDFLDDIVSLELNGLVHKCPSVKHNADCVNISPLFSPSSIRALIKFVDSSTAYPCIVVVEQSTDNVPCLMIGSDLINMIKREEVSSNVNVSREQY